MRVVVLLKWCGMYIIVFSLFFLLNQIQGILFFHMDGEMPSGNESVNLWSEADWPQNGWAGSVSTPAPTCVYPGVGLGVKKGAHLGLGGATVGVGLSARPRRDLTVSGAFGITGHAGTGTATSGWEIQEDFEDLVDPPATVENISTRALSSHPLRPLFLVGSSNTHIYLWEVRNIELMYILMWLNLHVHVFLEAGVELFCPFPLLKFFSSSFLTRETNPFFFQNSKFENQDPNFIFIAALNVLAKLY